MDKSRRDFLKKSAVAGTSVLLASSITGIDSILAADKGKQPFPMKFAPGFGAFNAHAGKDPVDNIKFCHDNGFTAMFDNGLMGRPTAEQERIVNAMSRLGMEMGPFVLYADFSRTSFVLKDESVRDMLVAKMKEGVECFKRTGVKWALVVPGRYDTRLHRDIQTANVVENLRYCTEVMEKAGLTIVLEPLNNLWDHPGLFLTGIPQAYSICKAVNNPYCKIVNDIYHQQISEGNIIPNINAAWEEIASFHVADNPGRKEPGTGELNYKNIFKHIKDKGYNGVICMEHGQSLPGKEGEKRVIEAYRSLI